MARAIVSGVIRIRLSPGPGFTAIGVEGETYTVVVTDSDPYARSASVATDQQG